REARRLDDGHVVGRLDGRAGDVGAGADAQVRQAAPDALPDDLDQLPLIQLVEQTEGVAAADKDALHVPDGGHRVGVPVQAVQLVTGVDTPFGEAADVGVVVG